MKERWKKISTGLILVLLSVAGLWEYMQLYLYFDLPQAIVILPILGAIAQIFLKKYGWMMPVLTAVISVVYQLVEKRSSCVGIVELSRSKVLLSILPVMLLFLFVGIGGGALIRVLLNRKKSLAVGILSCVIGVGVTFGSGLVMFQNPIYPFVAKQQINKYASKFEKEHYKISEVSVFFSLEDLQYQGRVVMSDGVIYALYHDRQSGAVTEAEK